MSRRTRRWGHERRLLLLAVLAVGGLRLPAAVSAAERLRVTASLPPQAWLVERIGGERVDAAYLVGPGDSPATFQPGDAEITRLARSVLFFRTGVPFENGPWLRAIERAGRPRIVDLRSGVDLRRAEPHAHGSAAHPPSDQSGHDPHIWLSPRRLRIQARTVAEALSAIDPEHAVGYRSRLATLDNELDTLDTELAAKLAPLGGTALFVFHPSWGYFADDYGLEQVAIEVEGKGPSEVELTERVKLARRHGIRVVFVQPQFKGPAAAAVAAAVGARLETLDPLAPDVARNLRQVTGKLLAAHGDPEWQK